MASGHRTDHCFDQSFFFKDELVKLSAELEHVAGLALPAPAARCRTADAQSSINQFEWQIVLGYSIESGDIVFGRADRLMTY
jgi:hypothetical protein